MLENEAALRTWRLLQPPQAGVACPAEPLPDHRLAYLNYEGPVSGNRGSVQRWDAGDYLFVQESAAGIEVRLAGRRLQGMARIQRNAAGGLEFRYEADPEN